MKSSSMRNNTILNQFHNGKLERLLIETSKNVAHELVMILLNTHEEQGILLILERKRMKYYSNLINDK